MCVSHTRLEAHGRASRVLVSFISTNLTQTGCLKIAEWVSSEGLRRVPETTQEVNLVIVALPSQGRSTEGWGWSEWRDDADIFKYFNWFVTEVDRQLSNCSTSLEKCVHSYSLPHSRHSRKFPQYFPQAIHHSRWVFSALEPHKTEPKDAYSIVSNFQSVDFRFEAGSLHGCPGACCID